MGGLREKRKNETKEKILSVSREIFFSKGYTKATVEEIAEKAGIGVGTVYNFFKTKADILISVVAQEAGLGNRSYEPDASDLERSAVDIVMNFSWQSFGKLKFLSKKIWKELLSAMFSTLKSESKLLKGLTSLDFQYIEKLRALLKNLKGRSVLTEDFDTESASMVVYDIFLTQFLLYIYSDETSFEQLEQNIRTQIGIVFEGKCSSKKTGA